MQTTNDNKINTVTPPPIMFPSITVIFGKLIGFLEKRGFASQLEKKLEEERT